MPELPPAGAADAEPLAPYALIDPALLERAYRLGVAATVLAAAGSGRVLGPTTGGRGAVLPQSAIDLGIGISDSIFAVAQRTIDSLSRAVSPAVGRVRGPVRRLLSGAVRAAVPVVAPVQERGRRRRAESEAEMTALVEALIPEIADLVVERIDLRAVLARIDLQDVLSRIDLQDLVEASVDHVDMNGVMARLDMHAAVDQMMGQVDLTQIAVDHIDVNRLMDSVLRQVDMVALLRGQLEGVDVAELLIGTPTSLASGAIRQTTRFVRRG